VSKSNGKTANSTKPAPPKPGAPAPTSDEAAFLAQQAADAKAAITQTLSSIGTDLGQTVNIAGWTREYPWLTLGASTIAGFVATAIVVPSKEQQALKRLAKIERALHTPPPKKQDSDHTNGDNAKDYKSGRQSFARSILGEVVKAVQPALLSMLTASVAGYTAKPSQEEMQAAAAAEDSGVPPTS
jgi:hypothetical protein